ncbi:MAG TPA: O-acetyl-ADP-ribose deacetylase [Aggregatilineales bacterium]|nr:O-acetyl-ADP-ribose deacetylase [Aggregatilineales bacterium]
MTDKIQVNQTTIDLEKGDLIRQSTDAIVNAANTQLAGGGGVDGAIHRAAGWDQLQAACRKIGGCPTGEAVITPGFALKARYIIHAVGPVYLANDDRSPALLTSAYRRSLEVGAENDIKSIAFPAISTGVYGYPMREAAAIALKTAYDFATENDRFELIRFVLFDSDAYDIFADELSKLD